MFAADARKHTPGKNAEKENFSMRILVCDDDAAFAGQLAEKIEAIVKPQMPRSTVDCATDAAQLRALPLAKYDLAFLDIDMGPLNGVDLARRLHELRPDMLLIFVTNYVEYSLQGYEVQAFRYLLKAEMPQKLERYVQQALTAYRKTRDTVRIFCDGEDVELQPQQILYAEMSARKVCLHLQGADRALLYTTATMADLADLLENHGFVRTHKSVLVNMEHIRDLHYDGSDAAELTQEKADEILAEAVRNASSDQVTATDGAAALSGVELFTLPVAPPPQVSGYDPENGHPGIDFAAEEGAEVYAVADGIVTTADYDAEKGNYVVLDHGGGLETEYQHLKSSLVSAGQSVVQCQVLGYVGSTGNSTGPHLHFEARQDSAPADLTGTALLAE